jgi:hypothetical protein
MANDGLDGDRIAILVTDGFEQVELLQPRTMRSFGETTSTRSVWIQGSAECAE